MIHLNFFIITVCDDVNGQPHNLFELFKVRRDCPDTKYLFLGDLVDRGFNRVETFLLLLLAFKVHFPDRITIQLLFSKQKEIINQDTLLKYMDFIMNVNVNMILQNLGGIV